MIKLIASGKYRLLEAPSHDMKVLYLDGSGYVWKSVEPIGCVLVINGRKPVANVALAAGSYRLYDVLSEPAFTNKKHLELFFGDGQWQGYLLPTGLPSGARNMARIISTKEIISARHVPSSK